MVYKQKYRIYPILFFGFCIALFSRCVQDDSSPTVPVDPPPVNVQIKPNDFLSEETYNKLTIEIACVQGYQPASAAIAGLKTFLENLLHKSAGIEIITRVVVSPEKTAYSLSDIREMEKNNRTMFPEGKTLAAWFFFADADYTGNETGSKVLGVAYGPTSMTIFEKTIKEFSGGLGQPSAAVLEETVMQHEFGHILGLVNNGTAMVENHLDTEHDKHCNNKNCLMYYAAEHSSGIISFLSGGTVPALDAACREDLKNNGGK
jgi:hypothetical protein